ncbi:MAG: 4Fe-4S binding protein [Anaerolineaceae bacterium]
MVNTYERLAKYLDALPAGFPPTPEGFELRILERLFTPPEAELALHLSLLDQDVQHVARQAGLGVEETAELLESMTQKGLINATHAKEKDTLYGISQFIIGFYEGQVNRLDVEMAYLFEAYAPIWFEKSSWKKVPQLRTIPIKQAISITHEVLPYMQAEEILRSNEDIAVRNCVCRQEQQVLGKGCERPIETCMTFGGAARNTVERGIGRMITQKDALEILKQAQVSGLVLQPSNSQNPMVLCMCCSCCCGVLRRIKADPNPGKLVANPFVTQFDYSACISCFACVEICPMEALNQDEHGGIKFAQERCIGCGLCIGVCPNEALELVRRSELELPRIPRNTFNTYLSLSKARGLGNVLSNFWVIFRTLIRQVFSG